MRTRFWAQEVKPFGIDFIIAEPGPTATKFGENAVRAEPMAVYDNTPAGLIRKAISTGAFERKGDAARTAAAIIAAASSEKPELRLVLGSTAYNSISKVLADRLSCLEGQHDIAFSADRAEA